MQLQGTPDSGAVRDVSGKDPGGAREVPEEVPEKGPIERVWPSAASGTDK